MTDIVERLRGDMQYGDEEVAADELERLRALSVETILLDMTPGWDGMGHEVYAKSVDQVVSKLTEMGGRIEDLELERVKLRAELDALRGQEPVAFAHYWRGGDRRALSWVSAIPADFAEGHSVAPLFLTPKPAIPDGFMLVPKEPTPEMISAALGNTSGIRGFNEAAYGRGVAGDYRAMLAAAPKPGEPT